MHGGSRKYIGGGLIMAAGAVLGRETFVWAWGKFLDFATDLFGRQGVSAVNAVNFPWTDALGLALFAGGAAVLWTGRKKHRLVISQDDVAISIIKNYYDPSQDRSEGFPEEQIEESFSVSVSCKIKNNGEKDIKEAHLRIATEWNSGQTYDIELASGAEEEYYICELVLNREMNKIVSYVIDRQTYGQISKRHAWLYIEFFGKDIGLTRHEYLMRFAVTPSDVLIINNDEQQISDYFNAYWNKPELFNEDEDSQPQSPPDTATGTPP